MNDRDSDRIGECDGCANGEETGTGVKGKYEPEDLSGLSGRVRERE